MFRRLVSCERRVGRGVTVAVSHGVCFGTMTYVVGDRGRVRDCGFRGFLASWVLEWARGCGDLAMRGRSWGC